MNYCLIPVLFAFSSVVLTKHTSRDLPEDASMTFNELARKYTNKGEEYDLIVEGGYILKLFRIPGDINKPILLVHGAVDSADSFIMRGNTSLAVALSRDNYDIWAINLRGNRYSRRHTSMNPDVDKQFWDFSLHEFGYYDLPATIDFILNKTMQETLSAIGYSEGTASMYVLGATRPEYNDKINIFISMAPICYLHNARMYMSLFMDIGPTINKALEAIGHEEVASFSSPMQSFVNAICSQRKTGYELCLLNGLFLITGENAKEIGPNFFLIVLGHFPAGTSRKNLNHLLQIRARRKFVNYDLGREGNMLKYNRPSPPDYDLSKVTMKVALFVGKNDRISTIKDVALLRKQLPNVVQYSVMKNDAFNHVDYVWGRNTHKTMFPLMFKLLDKYK